VKKVLRDENYKNKLKALYKIWIIYLYPNY
jgi:hypothetical protein